MPKIVLFILLIFPFLNCFGQQGTILVFDLSTGRIDSLPPVSFDTTLTSDQTAYYIGNFDSSIQTLSQTSPTSNIYPNTNFTYKKRAALDFDLNQYPIRTTTKIFYTENDTLQHLCSGNLISKKHVLTAAHCISDLQTQLLNKDSILVAPAFDDGLVHTQFGSSYVSKVYFYKNWRLNGQDIAILELEESIGAATGWLSIGFDQMNSRLSNGIFYKFGYPAITMLSIDSNTYNGDTLYYNYGNIDLFTNTTLGINRTSGIPGESGGGLIKIVNEQAYTVYGVLTTSNNLSHTRINNAQFYALKSIIAADLVSVNKTKSPIEEITIFPNPTMDIFHIQRTVTNSSWDLVLVNAIGKQILIKRDIISHQVTIDMSSFPIGIYYLQLQEGAFTTTKKIIKQ